VAEELKMKNRERDQRNLKRIRLVALAIVWLSILTGCSYEWKIPVSGTLLLLD
jgi:hypothetical protein